MFRNCNRNVSAYSLLNQSTDSKLSRTEQQKVNKELFLFYRKYILPTNDTPIEIKKCQAGAYLNLGLNKLFFFGAPFCAKYGINMLSRPDQIMYAPYMFISYGICYSSYVFFEGRRNQKLQEINITAMKDLAVKTYKHLLYLDGDYHMTSSSRQSLYSIYKAQKAVESNLRSLNQYFLPLTADILGTCALLTINFGWPFLATFCVTFTSYSIFTINYSNFRRKSIFQQKQFEKKADATISQALSNLFTVKYFNAEKYELNRYVSILEQLKSITLVNIKSLTTLNSMQRLILSVGLTVNLLLGVHGVQSGVMTPGDLVLIQSLMIQLFTPLFMLGMMHREWMESSIDIRDLFNILERKPKIVEHKNAVDFEYKEGSITLEDVSFKYGESTKLLMNKMNLQIQGGEWIVVIGESGVGKSTLFNLIFRLNDPTNGRVLLDGQDLTQLKLNSFRKYFGVVSQQSYFFNDSIRNNLMYGLDLIYEMTPERIKQKELEMKQYCKLLRLSKIIEALPKGYETPMGEQANKFSGGEKQRMQIVRCLLRGAKILLLDEPTSALDSHNENSFLSALESVVKLQDLTVIIITHRIHLNRIADKIICLGRNNDVEFGTHEELLQNGKGYLKMYNNYQQQ